MTSIVVLTGSELRHTFFRKLIALDPNIEVLETYCEGLEQSLEAVVKRKKDEDKTLRLKHIAARDQSEEDFFRLFVDQVEDLSHPVHIPRGDINKDAHIEKIIAHKPDLLVAYGCALIKGSLLDEFKGRFLNVHLGLSPYYRGSGTNFWPLVHGEPEYVGATFMHIDPGIDTGEIIHQIRARFYPGDTPSQVGNRLIADMATVYKHIILNFESLKKMPSLPPPSKERPVYKTRDCTEESIVQLYRNFSEGLVETYIEQREQRCKDAPIITNPGLPA